MAVRNVRAHHLIESNAHKQQSSPQTRTSSKENFDGDRGKILKSIDRASRDRASISIIRLGGYSNKIVDCSRSPGTGLLCQRVLACLAREDPWHRTLNMSDEDDIEDITLSQAAAASGPSHAALFEAPPSTPGAGPGATAASTSIDGGTAGDPRAI